MRYFDNLVVAYFFGPPCGIPISTVPL